MSAIRVYQQKDLFISVWQVHKEISVPVVVSCMYTLYFEHIHLLSPSFIILPFP